MRFIPQEEFVQSLVFWLNGDVIELICHRSLFSDFLVRPQIIQMLFPAIITLAIVGGLVLSFPQLLFSIKYF